MSVTKNHSLHLDSANYTKDQNIMKFTQKVCKLKLLIYPHSLQETGGLILFLKSSNYPNTWKAKKIHTKICLLEQNTTCKFSG